MKQFNICKAGLILPVILWLILAGTTDTQAQKLIKKYVKKNNVPIRTIEPDDNNYSDLESIGRAIGDARIVMLGEQDHGDARTYLAKTRLVKYLHEKKGFNVLAFEADFFALNAGWDNTVKSHPVIDTFFKHNIYQVWSATDAASNLLYNYIPQTHTTTNPLIVTGFDCQQYFGYTQTSLARTLDSIFRNLGIAITKQPNYAAQIPPLLDSLAKRTYTKKDSAFKKKAISILDTIKSQLTQVLDSNSFWLPVINNMIYFVDPPETNEERDSLMAQNLAWLSTNKFKDQKIIVWAADGHVSKLSRKAAYSARPDFNPSSDKAYSMGAFFTENPKNTNQVYIMGFASLQGTAGRIGIQSYALSVTDEDSFEHWIKTDYAFVDFNAFNLAHPNADEFFYATPLNHQNVQGKWYRVFNGLFFIKNMYPAKRVLN